MNVSSAFVVAIFFLSTILALEYDELTCNANASPKINTNECLHAATAFSTLLENSATVSSPVVIPCGTCYEVDYTNNEVITLEGGLNVLGHLYFPSTANMVLNTTSVVVQGMWSMTTPDVGNTVKISLYGTDDVYIYPHDNCCTLNGECNTECSDKANLESKPFAVVGGQLDIRAIDTNCPSWTTLKKADQANKVFTVDSVFASCLAIGDELLVASDDRNNINPFRYTIAAVNGEDVVVQEDIRKVYATEDGPGEAIYAAEVATLSRRVLFEGREDVPNIGAHSIIYHTPNVIQTIQGVSFKGFGQGGKLGRYPIHFHNCDDTNSLVSKNVIRDSHQRCVFIHNTNNVTIENNVAFSNKGHCYATETGIEHDNVFIDNLAVASYKLYVPGNGQSDDPVANSKHEAAAFWIRNMMNTFIGNRVAGCSYAGFWLEMKEKYGNQLNEDSFKDNVAHSCFTGLLTYKKGWIPAQPGHIKNMKVYRNNEGFKFHITGNVKFTNFFSADNSFNRYGAWNKGVDFEDSRFIGLSSDAQLRLGNSCSGAYAGIRASYNTFLDSRKQINLKNVEFNNFNCNSKTILWYHDDRIHNDDMGDPLMASNITFTGTSSESNQPAFDCENANVFMEDIDGVLGPDDKGPGFIVRNIPQMKAFLNNCEVLSYNGCSAMCESACLRLVHIKPLGSGDFHSLTLTDQTTQASYTWSIRNSTSYNEGKAVLVVPKATYQADFKDAEGNYITASSVDIEIFRAPECENYVDSTDFIFQTFPPTDPPTLTPTKSPITAAPSISIFPSEAPTTQCEGIFLDGVDKVVLNEGFETSLGSTWESWGGAQTEEYTPGASGAKALAMKYSVNPGGMLPAIRLSVNHKNKCIRGGMELGVSFKVKLLNMTDNDSPVDCIPGVDCPSGRFRARQPDFCNGWYALPRSIVSWNKYEFNEVSSLFTVPVSCEITNWNWFLLDITMGKGYQADTVKMIVDDVKVMIDEGQYTFPPTYAPTFPPTDTPTTPMPTPALTFPPTNTPTIPMLTLSPTTRCDGEFPNGVEKVLLNQGFESSRGSAWGGAKTEEYTPGASGAKALAMKYSVNPHSWLLPAIRLNVRYRDKCIRGGMELGVSFKAKMLNMTDNDSSVDCIPGITCPTARFRGRQNNACNGWYPIDKPTTAWNKDEYNTISTVWTVPSSCHGSTWLWLKFDITQGKAYPKDTVKILVDDVKIFINED